MLKVIEQEKPQENCLKLGAYIFAGLEKLKAEHKVIGDGRGKGLVLGIEFVQDRATKAPGCEECAQAVENARERGLWGQSIRCAPPMNITQADADFLLAVLDEAIGTT